MSLYKYNNNNSFSWIGKNLSYEWELKGWFWVMFGGMNEMMDIMIGFY